MDANFWRGVIFCQAGLVCVMTIAIIIRYAIALTLTKRRDRVLPLHVIAISLSYLLATIFIVMSIVQRWDDPMTYRTPLAGVIFVLGDAALVFMLLHMSIQRKYIGQVRSFVEAEARDKEIALAAELKRQTAGLAKSIKVVGEQAEKAYHEANTVNEKIVDLHKDFQASQIKQRGKINKIDEVGTDTNQRVRKIVPK